MQTCCVRPGVFETRAIPLHNRTKRRSINFYDSQVHICGSRCETCHSVVKAHNHFAFIIFLIVSTRREQGRQTWRAGAHWLGSTCQHSIGRWARRTAQCPCIWGLPSPWARMQQKCSCFRWNISLISDHVHGIFHTNRSQQYHHYGLEKEPNTWSANPLVDVPY